jgi:enoyl-CoA hydratase/carnithine racemase
MAVTHFDDYKDRYDHIKLERDEDGILLMQMHTDGGDVEWGLPVHDNMSDVWRTVGSDPENRVIILTGSGETFLDKEIPIPDKNWITPEGWVHLHTDAKRLVLDHLEVEVPIIAAINGNVRVHSEQALLCDISIASEDALFGDHPHFVNGVVAGDGVQVIWPLVVGLNRARYFLMSGEEITAKTAQEWGAVNEVVPKDQVLPRAYELARRLAERPSMALRTQRMLMLAEVKKVMLHGFSHGLMTEGLVAMGTGWQPNKGAELQSASASSV